MWVDLKTSSLSVGPCEITLFIYWSFQNFTDLPSHSWESLHVFTLTWSWLSKEQNELFWDDKLELALLAKNIELSNLSGLSFISG